MLATLLGCVCLGISSLIYLSVSNLSVYKGYLVDCRTKWLTGIERVNKIHLTLKEGNWN